MEQDLLSTSPASSPTCCTASKLRSVSIFAAFFGQAYPEPVRVGQRVAKREEPVFELLPAGREEHDDFGAGLRAELL
jgi:hypothetical protein